MKIDIIGSVASGKTTLAESDPKEKDIKVNLVMNLLIIWSNFETDIRQERNTS